MGTHHVSLSAAVFLSHPVPAAITVSLKHVRGARYRFFLPHLSLAVSLGPHGSNWAVSEDARSDDIQIDEKPVRTPGPIDYPHDDIVAPGGRGVFL